MHPKLSRAFVCTLRFTPSRGLRPNGPSGFCQIVSKCLRANLQKAGRRPAFFIFGPLIAGARDTRARQSAKTVTKSSVGVFGNCGLAVGKGRCQQDIRALVGLIIRRYPLAAGAFGAAGFSNGLIRIDVVPFALTEQCIIHAHRVRRTNISGVRREWMFAFAGVFLWSCSGSQYDGE